jgi:hypothetical protein
MDIAAELRSVGVDVITGPRPRGSDGTVGGVVETWIAVEQTATVDLNAVVIPENGHFYVERSGRVWVFANGPRLGEDGVVGVWLAGTADDAPTAQITALEALRGVLGQGTEPEAKPKRRAAAKKTDDEPEEDDEVPEH